MAETRNLGPARPWASSSRTVYHNAGRHNATDPAEVTRPDHPIMRRQLEQGQQPRRALPAPSSPAPAGRPIEPRTRLELELEAARTRNGELAAQLLETRRVLARLIGCTCATFGARGVHTDACPARGQAAPAPAQVATAPEVAPSAGARRDGERDLDAASQRFSQLELE